MGKTEHRLQELELTQGDTSSTAFKLQNSANVSKTLWVAECSPDRDTLKAERNPFLSGNQVYTYVGNSPPHVMVLDQINRLR